MTSVPREGDALPLQVPSIDGTTTDAATAADLRIPFTEIGDFVFHRHVLEHEDGGMAVRIRVAASPVTDLVQ